MFFSEINWDKLMKKEYKMPILDRQHWIKQKAADWNNNLDDLDYSEGEKFNRLNGWSFCKELWWY